MLSLNRKTDYALVALAHMADAPGQWTSAREIAEGADIPIAVVMNVLKSLHQGGLLRSTRGVRGGYRIGADLEQVSLFDVARLIEKTDESAEANGGEPPCCGRYKIDQAGRHGPVHAFHHQLRQFLKSVKLSDLVLPGRRIDVPVELVSTGRLDRKKAVPRRMPVGTP